MTSFLRTYSIAIAAGVVLALCFPTWHLYPLAWVALAPLFARTWHMTARAAARQFFVSGLAFYLVLLQWLMSNVYWAGGWAFWGYLALCVFMASYWALSGALWMLLRSTEPRIPAPLSLAVLWAAMEYLQSVVFSGFGWGALAYSQGKDLAFLQWAALGGTPLMAAVLVWFNTLLAGAVVEPRHRVLRIGMALMAIGAAHGLGYLMLGTPDYGDRPFEVGMVQADFPLEMKWDPEYTVDMVRNTAQKSRILAQQKHIDLFVWPESLIMGDIQTPGILEAVSGLARDTGAYLFVGSDRLRPDGGDMNSSFLVSPEGALSGYYDKIHLAPFGEYVPFGKYLPFIEEVVPTIGGIEAGDTPKTFPVGERRIGPLICFEVLFAPMARRLAQDGADLLVVITNLGWFGASNAIGEELEIARVRAVENRMPLAHCANTGITGMFDPWGRFTVIDTFFDGTGGAYRISDRIGLEDTRMHRLGGVLPAAKPAPRPFAWGPELIPYAFLGLSCVMVLWCVARRFGASRPAPES